MKLGVKHSAECDGNSIKCIPQTPNTMPINLAKLAILESFTLLLIISIVSDLVAFKLVKYEGNLDDRKS